MTKRVISHMKSQGIVPEKIKRGCDYIFKYLEQEEFSLKEVNCLISSMGSVIYKMTEKDPLRKIGDFDYSDSIESSFPSMADSKTES